MLEGLTLHAGLRELHLEHQQLPPGETLVLEPRTLRALQVRRPWRRGLRRHPVPRRSSPKGVFRAALQSLAVLNLAGNRLASLAPLQGCTALETLNVSDNCLPTPATLVPLLAVNPELCVLAGGAG